MLKIVLQLFFLESITRLGQEGFFFSFYLFLFLFTISRARSTFIALTRTIFFWSQGQSEVSHHHLQING